MNNAFWRGYDASRTGNNAFRCPQCDAERRLEVLDHDGSFRTAGRRTACWEILQFPHQCRAPTVMRGEDWDAARRAVREIGQCVILVDEKKRSAMISVAGAHQIHVSGAPRMLNGALTPMVTAANALKPTIERMERAERTLARIYGMLADAPAGDPLLNDIRREIEQHLERTEGG